MAGETQDGKKNAYNGNMGIRVPFPPPRDEEERERQIAELERRIKRTETAQVALLLFCAVALLMICGGLAITRLL